MSCFKAWNVPLDIPKNHPKPSQKNNSLGGMPPDPLGLWPHFGASSVEPRLYADSNTRCWVKIFILPDYNLFQSQKHCPGFFVLHIIIENTAHFRPLNSLEHCIHTNSMVNIRSDWDSNPVPLSFESLPDRVSPCWLTQIVKIYRRPKSILALKE